MTAEKTKLPPMMAMVLRYGTAARLWSHARSIMADPAPEVARARTLRAQYSFGGDTGSEKSSENMHKVASFPKGGGGALPATPHPVEEGAYPVPQQEKGQKCEAYKEKQVD